MAGAKNVGRALSNTANRSLLLYFDRFSQPSRTLEIFLRASGIPFEPKLMQLMKGEHFTEEFAKLNPLRKAPLIVDGDFVLTESVAIARYLCRERSVPDHWYPKDSPKMARVDEFLEWHHIGLRAPCALYAQAQYIIPFMKNEKPNEKKVNSLRPRMISACDTINDVWLKNDFIAGNEISIADIFAATELEQLRMTDYNPREGRTKLAEWIERVRQKTNPHYDEAHSTIYKVESKIKGKSSKL